MPIVNEAFEDLVDAQKYSDEELGVQRPGPLQSSHTVAEKETAKYLMPFYSDIKDI